MIFHSNECINLPHKWQNKVSSILVNKCIVLYSKQDCQTEKHPQLFKKGNDRYLDVSLSQPDNIPNFNFYGSWYTELANRVLIIFY